MSAPDRLRSRLHALYTGHSLNARRFRYGLVAFDLLTIAVFIIASMARDQWWLVPLDFAIGTLLTIELLMRVYADPHWRKPAFGAAVALDVVVIVSLFLPALLENLAFLRILRALRLFQSYRLLKDLRQSSSWFRLNEDIIQRSLNLAIFIFIITSFVYVTQNGVNKAIVTYIDALYFTITTLTTTGFGDITLVGPGGRLLAVVIMVVGVSLFLRLLQAVFRPNKVRFECPDCALLIHDIDAVHCKHCGKLLAIPNEGVV